MGRKYPYHSGSESIKSPDKNLICVFCKQGYADRFAEVQFGWSRSDDANYHYHAKCLSALCLGDDAHKKGKAFLQAGLAERRAERERNNYAQKHKQKTVDPSVVEPHIRALIKRKDAGEPYDKAMYAALQKKYPVIFNTIQGEKA